LPHATETKVQWYELLLWETTMNWKLILRLSSLGLLMALGSVSFIPRYVESAFLLGMCLFYAYQIGTKTRASRFLHGLVLGVINNLWFVAVDDLFLNSYLVSHPRGVHLVEWAQSTYHWSPRAVMSVTGMMLGLGFGLVLGVFSMIAGMMTRPRPIQLTHDITT
jgi:hypothetical protein